MHRWIYLQIAHWIFVPWAVLLIVWAVARMAARQPARQQRSELRFAQAALLVVGLWMIFGSPFWLRGTVIADRMLPAHAATAIVGLALTAAGMLLYGWVRVALRGGERRAGRRSIRTGLDRRLPYCADAGLIIALLGTAIVYSRAECFVGVLLIVAGCSIKAWSEAREGVLQK